MMLPLELNTICKAHTDSHAACDRPHVILRTQRAPHLLQQWAQEHVYEAQLAGGHDDCGAVAGGRHGQPQLPLPVTLHQYPATITRMVTHVEETQLWPEENEAQVRG